MLVKIIEFNHTYGVGLVKNSVGDTVIMDET